VNWLSPLRIGEQYGVSPDGMYRHARALDLTEKRRRNVRAALERIIEKAGEVDVNAAAIVSAVGTYARINNRGEFVERTETVNLNALFKGMTVAELDAYATNGTLPGWFEGLVGAAAPDGKKRPNHA